MHEWERERERVSPLHFIRSPPCCAVGRFISRRPRWSWLLPVWKRRPLTRVGDRYGMLVYEYCESSHWQVEFMLCGLYLKWEKRERETERESSLPDHVIYKLQLDENCIVFTRQFSRVLTPGPSSLGFSRESPAGDMWCYVAYVYNGELVSLIGNKRVGIFPPKSKILFVLSLALIWCQNFQDGTIPVGGDTWPSCTSERKYKNKNNEKETYANVCEAVRKKYGCKIAGQLRDRLLAFKQSFSDVSSN